MDGGAWCAAAHGVTKSQTQLSDFTFTFHFHALEKEMATHSSVLAWRIPGTEKPGGLPSMGSHRVGHDWSDLAAAAAALYVVFSLWFIIIVVFTIFLQKMSYMSYCKDEESEAQGVKVICWFAQGRASEWQSQVEDIADLTLTIIIFCYCMVLLICSKVLPSQLN